MGQRGRLLLADPDPEQLAVMEVALRRRGFVCDSARDHRGARQAVDSIDYDVVLSELAISGDEELDFAASLSRRADAPVQILLAARPSVESAVRAVELRIFSYLVKPVELSVLLARVDAAVQQGRARRRVEALRRNLAAAGESLCCVDELLDAITAPLPAGAPGAIADGLAAPGGPPTLRIGEGKGWR